MSRKVTRQAMIVEHLKQQGHTVVDSRSRKHIKVARAGREGEFFFVGKGGGVRAGRTMESSISLTYQFAEVGAAPAARANR